METNYIDRRDFIRTVLSAIPFTVMDWSSFPTGEGSNARDDKFDVVIIGSGLGGLSCAAAFARQGFKPLILEKHDKPGGYATTFSRPGGFVFDVSLHSTTVGERNGIRNLISGFPEIGDVEFVPHPVLYRAIYPDYDIRVQQKDVAAYVKTLSGLFPEEQSGIQGLIDDMKGVSDDIQKLSRARGQVDMSQFSMEFPHLFQCFDKTWGQMMDVRIRNPKLRSVISALWGYYGLPPSKLASFYYALPTLQYLQEGGFYPIGKSQKISNALVKFIEERGGRILLNTEAKQILTKDHAAYAVKTVDGTEYAGKVIVSNADAFHIFQSMANEAHFLMDYFAQMDKFSVSLSCFQIFLGLKDNLVGKIGIKDTEIFYNTEYDIENSYEESLKARLDNGGYGMMLYDNLYKGYSPDGKNTLSIMTLQGYEHWKEYESEYFKGSKGRYNAEKERMAEILIKKVDRTLLPGLSSAIEVKEIGTPLTNLRYTGNFHGAIYGWDQTPTNSGNRRLPHKTPIKNLYLAGAWTRPGHGYGAVLGSGLECFSEIMKTWS
jgi:all-trans-retinol 13,14-reductase